MITFNHKILLFLTFFYLMLVNVIAEVPLCNSTGNITDPDDHNCFYQCDNLGEPTHYCCPEGFRFNDKIAACDKSGNVKYFSGSDRKKCQNKIHRKCYQESYNEADVDKVRKWIQDRFLLANPLHPPSKPPCPKLHVRRDIKCLSKKERSDLIKAWKQLYKSGVIDALTNIHASYWPATHKFSEGLVWHRWHVNRLEQELRKINSNITLPYWELITEFTKSEKSVVWDYFGHAGNKQNNYTVKDGPFANQSVLYPEPHLLKRQWNRNGTISTWEPPEWMTSFMQKKHLWVLYSLFNAYTVHFKPHLAIGGYAGDFSIPVATNDPLFYLFHAHQADFVVLKWQLSNFLNLVPLNYDIGLRLDWANNKIVIPSLYDPLTYYNVTIKETFEVGFGELCYIYDQMINPILDIINNKKRPLPSAVKRLKASLPPKVFAFWFPKFEANIATYFDYLLPEIGNCNTECVKMPIAPAFKDTPQGRRQYQAFVTDANFDITVITDPIEKLYYKFMNDLNRYGYCSPYV